MRRIPTWAAPITWAVLLTLTLSLPAWAASGPNGFKGIKWGTPLSKLSDMEQVYKEGPLTAYVRKDDDLSLGPVKADAIHYWFSMDMFVMATAVYRMENGSAEELQRRLSSRYGQPVRLASGGYSWRFDHNAVCIRHQSDGKLGYVTYEVNRFPDPRSNQEIGAAQSGL